MTPVLHSTTPVLHVHDVAATMAWYHEQLGFAVDPFPRQPPYVFCILRRDQIEIMLQKVEGAQTLDIYRHRPGGAWHVYLRMNGLAALYETVRGKPAIAVVEPPHEQPYGNTEFAVRDPNGYVLVFAEETRR